MGKGVANLYRYAEISLAANGSYLDALSVESDPRPARESLRELTAPVTHRSRRFGGFNPLKNEDAELFKAVMNGDYVAFGFQNRDIRQRLFGQPRNRKDTLRLSAKTSRLFKKLQVHGLIAKVPRSR